MSLALWYSGSRDMDTAGRPEQNIVKDGFKLQGLYERCLSLPNQKELSEAARRVCFWVVKALCRGRDGVEQGHRVSTWLSAGLKVTVAGCWPPLLFGSRAGGTGGFGLLGSSSRLVLILLLYIFSRIRTKATRMMTTTTMAATMAPELLYRKSSPLVMFSEKTASPKVVAVVILIQ